MPAGPGEVGLVIVRIWREPSSASGFRARISTTPDVERVDEQSVTTESVDDIVRVVDEFLRVFADQPATPKHNPEL